MRRVAVIDELGSDIEDGISNIHIKTVSSFQTKQLTSEQIIVDVKACAVNYPDLMQVKEHVIIRILAIV
jgi:NADPH:quinone reductase-like Zn-dependent oxidoreductase